MLQFYLALIIYCGVIAESKQVPAIRCGHLVSRPQGRAVVAGKYMSHLIPANKGTMMLILDVRREVKEIIAEGSELMQNAFSIALQEFRGACDSLLG